VKPTKSATKIETAISNSMANPPWFCGSKHKAAHARGEKEKAGGALPAKVAHQQLCTLRAREEKEKARHTAPGRKDERGDVTPSGFW
jgi:hypothetical protein